MPIIKIKNFGPITENRDANGTLIDNGCFTVDIKPVCIFIGPQASGKSTITKLYSMFSWLEKTFVRTPQPITLSTAIFHVMCEQQEIGEYVSKKSYILYKGDAFTFEYNGEKNLFKKRKNAGKKNPYTLPKIQYISSARNLLTILHQITLDSTIDKKGNTIELSSSIPLMVKDLNKEYYKALDTLAKKGFTLPIKNTSVFF